MMVRHLGNSKSKELLPPLGPKGRRKEMCYLSQVRFGAMEEGPPSANCNLGGVKALPKTGC